jgi:hypothetical protein
MAIRLMMLPAVADGAAGSGTGTKVEAVKTDAGKLPGCSRSTGNRRVIG